jgi:hypothetical protein
MRKLYILISLMVVLLLSGCVKGVFHITVNKDGSGDLDYRLAIDSALLSNDPKEDNPLEEFKTLAKKDGFIVSQFKENSYFGVEAKKKVENISKGIGEELFNSLSSSDQKENVNFSIKKGFLFNVYQLKTNFDLKDFVSKDNDPIASMFTNKMDLKMLLTLPVEVENHNASRIVFGDSEKVKTYEWDIIPGQDNEIYLEAKVLNITNILLMILLGVGLIIVTFYTFKKRPKIQEG